MWRGPREGRRIILSILGGLRGNRGRILLNGWLIWLGDTLMNPNIILASFAARLGASPVLIGLVPALPWRGACSLRPFWWGGWRATGGSFPSTAGPRPSASRGFCFSSLGPSSLGRGRACFSAFSWRGFFFSPSSPPWPACPTGRCWPRPCPARSGPGSSPRSTWEAGFWPFWPASACGPFWAWTFPFPWATPSSSPWGPWPTGRRGTSSGGWRSPRRRWRWGAPTSAFP